ncbi:Hint domain-containing protein [Halomonas eurihalina]|uniref:Hint domain-containing protein n=1 Tax=Halomonas eurihalina TaxID=42566 RepID=A0A5D9DAA3_HALER|nr:Hint domain-containing protein [Halomonas eurihalina]MDR5858492.1 Hint domain-containing protein [Halomonas eurihalina]TZG40686.1 Hint domain-containing protein [Halomonas eurihalina]
MALIDLDLANSGTQTISSDNADDTNTLNITALGSQELIVDGVEATVGNVAGVQAGASPTFTSTNGGSLTVDQGLLNVSGLNSFTFGIEGASSATLNASDLSTLNGLNSYDVNFSGSEAGSFTFNKGSISLLDDYSFNVTGMEAGDELNLGGGDWSLDEGSILNPQDAYRDGALHLTQGNSVIGGSVNARIEMTQEEYDEFAADPDAYLSGNTFTQVCFAAGTMIATPDGEVAVETLSIGDLVVTASGKQVPVKWIGHQTVNRLRSSGSQAPVRISEGALAPNVPNQDLVLTASHGVLVDGLVINAGALVNHDSIDHVSWLELSESVTYYHVETENHEVILANGTEAETYIDYIDRQSFDNYAEYVALYGMETRVVEMPRHRISSRRLLPLAVRERLGIQDMTQATGTA